MNTMSAFTALALSHPDRNAPVGVVAAWYERKAALHEALAHGCRSVDERVIELGYAVVAHEHARRLRDDTRKDLRGGVLPGQELAFRS